jgi:hypothetical protein
MSVATPEGMYENLGMDKVEAIPKKMSDGEAMAKTTENRLYETRAGFEMERQHALDQIAYHETERMNYQAVVRQITKFLGDEDSTAKRDS